MEVLRLVLLATCFVDLSGIDEIFLLQPGQYLAILTNPNFDSLWTADDAEVLLAPYRACTSPMHGLNPDASQALIISKYFDSTSVGGRPVDVSKISSLLDSADEKKIDNPILFHANCPQASLLRRNL